MTTMLRFNPSLPVKVKWKNDKWYDAQAYVMIDYDKETNPVFLCSIDNNGKMLMFNLLDLRMIGNPTFGIKGFQEEEEKSIEEKK